MLIIHLVVWVSLGLDRLGHAHYTSCGLGK